MVILVLVFLWMGLVGGQICNSWSCAQIYGSSGGYYACAMSNPFASNKTMVVHTNNAEILLISYQTSGLTFSTSTIISYGAEISNIDCAVINGLPSVVAFIGGAIDDIYYLQYDGAVWNDTRVFSGVNIGLNFVSLIEDRHSEAVVAFTHNAGVVYSIRSFTISGGVPTTVVVLLSDTGQFGNNLQLFLWNYEPAVIYYRPATTDLGLIYNFAAPIDVTHSDGTANGNFASGMDYFGVVQTVYLQNTNTLRSATYNGVTWNSTTLASTVTLTSRTELQCVDGYPSVAVFEDATNQIRVYTQQNTTAWSLAVVGTYATGTTNSISYTHAPDGGMALAFMNNDRLQYCMNPDTCYAGGVCVNPATHTQTVIASHTQTETFTSTTASTISEPPETDPCEWDCDVVGVNMGTFVDIENFDDDTELIFHAYDTLVYVSYTSDTGGEENFTHILIYNSTEAILDVSGTKHPIVFFITEGKLFFSHPVSLDSLDNWTTPAVIDANVTGSHVSADGVILCHAIYQKTVHSLYMLTETEPQSYVFTTSFIISNESAVIGSDPSVADIYGRPIFSSHINNVTNDLLYGRQFRNLTWEFETLEPALDSGRHSSISNYFGTPLIAYYADADIKLAWQLTNETWLFSILIESIPSTAKIAMQCIGGHTLGIVQNHNDTPVGVRVTYGVPESLLWHEELVYATNATIYYADIERVNNSLHVAFQEDTTLLICHKAAECIVETACEILPCNPTLDECDYVIFPDNCSYLCQWIECGNFRLDPTEECEFTLTPLNCTSDCTWSVCGNLVIEPGEECDPPSAFCTVDCLVNWTSITVLAIFGTVGVALVMAMIFSLFFFISCSVNVPIIAATHLPRHRNEGAWVPYSSDMRRRRRRK